MESFEKKGTINISDLNKADVLAALYNASKPLNFGFMDYDPTPMTREAAEKLLAQTTYFDYLNGRVMKVKLASDELDVWGYDRDNGEGAAELVVSELRAKGTINGTMVQATHHVNTLESAEDTKEHLGDKTKYDEEGGTLHLGLSNHAEELGPAVDEALKKLRE